MADNNPTEGGFRAGIETGPDGKPTGNIICYPSFSPNCIVVTLPTGGANAGFLSPSKPTRFHDEVLIKATHKINKILGEAAQERRQDSRKPNLHLYLADDGPMLIWVDTMAMQTDDLRTVSVMSASE